MIEHWKYDEYDVGIVEAANWCTCSYANWRTSDNKLARRYQSMHSNVYYIRLAYLRMCKNGITNRLLFFISHLNLFQDFHCCPIAHQLRTTIQQQQKEEKKKMLHNNLFSNPEKKSSLLIGIHFYAVKHRIKNLKLIRIFMVVAF